MGLRGCVWALCTATVFSEHKNSVPPDPSLQHAAASSSAGGRRVKSTKVEVPARLQEAIAKLKRSIGEMQKSEQALLERLKSLEEEVAEYRALRALGISS